MFGTVTPGGCEQLFIDIEALNADTPEKIAVIEARLGIINDVTLALNLASVSKDRLPAPHWRLPFKAAALSWPSLCAARMRLATSPKAFALSLAMDAAMACSAAI